MKKFYIVFGQGHFHQIGKKVFNKDCVAVLCARSEKEAKKNVEMIFSTDFAYIDDEKPNMVYFPRKLIKL